MMHVSYAMRRETVDPVVCYTVCTLQKACNSKSVEKHRIILVVFGLTSAGRGYGRGGCFFNYSPPLPGQEFRCCWYSRGIVWALR